MNVLNIHLISLSGENLINVNCDPSLMMYYIVHNSLHAEICFSN